MNKNKGIALTLWFAAAALLGFATGSFNWYDALPDCKFEDSVNCHWDASTRGNGQGHSFVNLADNIIYLD